jgi:hypothetical protein
MIFFLPGTSLFYCELHSLNQTGLRMREGEPVEPGSVDLGLECKEHDMEVDWIGMKFIAHVGKPARSD